MQVTTIQRTRRGRYSIFLDGEFYCALHRDVYAVSGLREESRVSPETIEELRLQSEQRITQERALRLLGPRSYTEQGLYNKLCERTDEEIAAAVVARMVELGLLDDEDYARRYAAECMDNKGFSHWRTARELERKGIDPQIVEDVLGEEGDPRPAIARVIERKYMRYVQAGDEKGYRKTVNALTRRGFRYGDIRAVIEHLLEDEAYYREQD